MHPNFLETKRLYLREFCIDDLPAVHEYANLPDFSQYDFWGPNTEKQSMEFIETAISKAKQKPRLEYEMGIVLKDSNRLIGGAHLTLAAKSSATAEVGYAVNPKFQNQGYATEIIKALIKYTFEKFNLKIIYATCDTRNIASYMVMQKCNMQIVSIVIGDRKIRSGVYDSYRYEIYNV